MSYLSKLASFLILLSISCMGCATPGMILWEADTQGAIPYDPAVGPDGSIYVPTVNNLLWAFNKSGQKLWAYPLLPGHVFTSEPAVSSKGSIAFVTRATDEALKYPYYYLLTQTGQLKASGAVATYWGNQWTELHAGAPIFLTDDSFVLSVVGKQTTPASCLTWGSLYYHGGNLTPFFASLVCNGNPGAISFENNRFSTRSDDSLMGFMDIMQQWGSPTTLGVTKWPTPGRWVVPASGILPTQLVGDAQNLTVGPGDSFYFTTNTGSLYAYEASLEPRWRVDNLSAIPLGNVPAVSSDGSIFVGGMNGYVVCFNTDSSIRWKALVSGQGINHNITMDDNKKAVYVVDATGHLYALDVNDGHIRWSETHYTFTTSPILTSGGGSLYLGTSTGELIAISTI